MSSPPQSKPRNPFRHFLKRHMREPMSAVTHGIAAVIALAGLIILIVETLQAPDRMVAMIVYGLTLVLAFSSSTMLHWVKAGPKVISFFNRLDHAAIYLLIAGSYTPICYIALTGFWQWGMLILAWGIAIVGVAYKLFWFEGGHSEWLSTGSYLAMGWLAVIAFPEILARMPAPAIVLIVLGGLVYSAGVYFYLGGIRIEKADLPRPFFGPHEWWHLFVMGGSLLHFLAVWLYLARV